MREIVHIQGGQCGNQIGAKFWEVIADEHGIDPSGTYAGDSDVPSTHFSLSESGKFQPRAVLVDMDGDGFDDGAFVDLFNQDNIIVGRDSARGNYAYGFYSDTATAVATEAMEVVRKEAEGCETLKGFNFTSALGGGTGSGTMSLLMNLIKEMYPKAVIETQSITPGYNKMSGMELINLALSLSVFRDTADQAMFMDNQRLLEMCRARGLEKPRFEDMNELVADVISLATTPYRFPGEVGDFVFPNSPFRKNPFVSPSYFGSTHRALTVPELTQQMFDAKNMMCAADPRHGRYLTATALFRGRMSTKEVDEQMLDAQTQYSDRFVKWIPNNIKTSVCDIPPRHGGDEVLFVGNNTVFGELFKRVAEYFTGMFRRRAFLHWYTGEGMDEMEFTEAESNMNDLVSEYQQYQDATAEEEGEFDEEEGEYDMQP